MLSPKKAKRRRKYLNTWHDRPEERWDGQTSIFLQVLVSILSLILWSIGALFQRAGLWKYRGTPASTASSIEHDAKIRQATVKWGMFEQIRKSLSCFKEVNFEKLKKIWTLEQSLIIFFNFCFKVIQKHFYYKRK